MPIESFAPGTIMIPMDQTYQDSGMFIAYGLVYELLDNGIPVKWAIAMGKAYNGIDFTATADDYATSTPIGTHDYSGGPFIIDSTDVTPQALTIINTWIANYPFPPPNPTVPAIQVHQATAPFTADIAATMTRAPHIAVEFANPGQIFAYLNAAAIPDDNGNPWSNSSPSVFTALQVGLGVLFDNPLDPCAGLDYTTFLSTQSNDPRWKSPSLSVNAMNAWLAMGGVLSAYSGSLPTFENIGQVGPFLTTNGFSGFLNNGDPGLFINEPDYPVMQTLTPLASGPETLPAGGVVTWLTSSVTYNLRSRVLAYFMFGGNNYDFFIGGSYKDGAGAGKVYYEGGQAYQTAMPYSLNPDASFVRFIYNILFWSIAKPLLVLTTTPKQVPTAPSTVSFSLDNIGGAEALNTLVTVTLAPWAIYNNDASIPPTSIVGQTLTWNLGTVPYGNVLTFTADIDPPAGGFHEVAQYTASYDDAYFQMYNIDECTSVEVIPGAEPVISKNPPTQGVNPNDPISWTITVSNNGVLPLSNVVVTDILPVGLTYVSATPVPSSVTGGGLLPTTIIWQTPQIPDPLNPSASFLITLNALAPPATTATFINEVTVTGDDSIPFSYSTTDTAEVTVTDRPPTVTLTSPNGGELVCGGINITWTASDPDGDPLTFDLEYSPDGGMTFFLIASGLTSSPYFWNTSALTSGNDYIVRVTASDGLLSTQDQSDGPFTIDNTPPVVVMIAPPDGSILTAPTETVSANATDNVGVTSVDFEYSSDGLIWTLISTETVPVSGNTYSTTWNTGAVPSGAYFLRATAFDGCSLSSSDTINVIVDRPPTVTLTSPNGGELLCGSWNVTWIASDPDLDPLTFDLEYSADGGVSFNPIASGLTSSPYFWNTTALPSGTDYLVRITVSDGLLTAQDVSDGPFTIDNTPPVVNLTVPPDGSLLTGTVAVSATATDNIGVTAVDFEYSPDGITWTLISTETVPVTDSLYSTSWDTTTAMSGSYFLRAVAFDQCSYSTASQITVFVDQPPTVTLISPNGGEIVCGSINITWTAFDPDADPLTFDLEYSADGGISFSPIASGLTSSPYFWDTSALPSGINYMVRITASDGTLSDQDVSDGPFTIDNTPPVVVIIAPADGSILTAPTETVSANATDNIAVTAVDFEYSTDGITYTLISTETIPVSGNTYSTTWNTGLLPSGAYFLRAVAFDQCSNTDQSEINVIVDRPPTVTLTMPNGGELVCGGINITWMASDPDTDPLTFDLEYSADGGVSFSPIASGLTSSPYFWNTTALPSGTNYIVRIIASDGFLTAQDVSDGPFTIDNNPPVVNLTEPIAGSILTGTVTISATAMDNVSVSSVDFEYSSDGISWTLISTETVPVIGDTYTTSWDTTTVIGGPFFLRATAFDQCNYSASSQISVIVDQPPQVTLISPNGGEIICPTGTTITWTAFDPDGDPLTFDLYYSSNGGISFTLLVSGLTTTSYFWDTSSLPTGTAYIVRVIASDGILTDQDESDGPFTLDNSPPMVNLTAPPDGSILSGIVSVSATATDNIGVNRVEFEYSPDGITFTLIGIETTPVSGNTYSTNWDTTLVSPSGSYILRATSFDDCNNSAFSQIDVIVDQPPQVTVISPNGGEIICPPGTTITWTAFDPDGDPLTYSILYSADGGTTFNLLVTGLTTTSFFWDTSSLPSGDNYLVRVVASDGILTGQDDSDTPFTIDNTPPLVTIIFPPGGAYVTGTATVSATATDNVSVTSVTFEYSVDGVIWNLIAIVTVPLGDTYAAPWDTTTVADGPYTLRATAVDQCSNSSQDISTVIVDNTPPTVSIDNPPDGATVFDIVNLLISAADNQCLAKVDVYIDGVLVHTEFEGDTTSTTFIYEWNTNEFAEGSHVVRAVATDCAGLTAETQHTYIVDNLPEHFTQLLIDGNLKIPELKPNIEKILAFDVTVVVQKINIVQTHEGSKVIVSGYLEISVTYAADVEQQSEHFAHFWIPFAGMILWPDLPTDSCLCPVIVIEHEQHHLLGPRTIKKDIVLFVGVRLC